jgi:choline dehydrogenase-like flavoprotein
MKCSDILVQRGAAKIGAKVIHVRKSTLTRAKFGRPACHYCGNCMAGCDVAAKYNSWDGHMRPLMKTGKITLQLDSIVYDIGMDKSKNRATSVRYIDRTTKKQGEVQGRVVVLAAACVQNIALFLQSGLANSSGRVGKDFIPHFTGGVEAFLTKLIGKPVTNDEGFLDHAYLPSFMHTKKRDYARSWGAQFNYQNRRSVGWARAIPGMGESFKSAVKDRYPSYFIFSPYGEKTPDDKSYVALDKDTKDKYGMPEIKRHLYWNENDMKIFRDMQKQSVAILEAAGAEIHRVYDEPRPNHEIGGTIMGKDPRKSVTDSYGKTHDIDNLYTLGGNILPSASEKNPTHTFMALSARTAAHLIERFKRGDLV